MDYQKKYLKYKNKYFFLKQKGGEKCPKYSENLLVQMHKDKTTPFITALNLNKQCAIEEIIKSKTGNLTQVEKDIALKKYTEYIINKDFDDLLGIMPLKKDPYKFIEILLKKGANPNNAILRDGETILIVVLDVFQQGLEGDELIENKISDKYIEILTKVDFLLNYKHNPNHQDKWNMYALDYAVRINYPSIVFYMLKKGRGKIYESTMRNAKNLLFPHAQLSESGLSDEKEKRIKEEWKKNNHEIITILNKYKSEVDTDDL